MWSIPRHFQFQFHFHFQSHQTDSKYSTEQPQPMSQRHSVNHMTTNQQFFTCGPETAKGSRGRNLDSTDE